MIAIQVDAASEWRVLDVSSSACAVEELACPLMVGSTMTYRQAIEALGETAKQKIISDQQMQASAQSLAEAQAFANQQMQTLQDGFIDAIIAGESFADVLKNVAAQMAKAWAQAALFGSGPLAL